MRVVLRALATSKYTLIALMLAVLVLIVVSTTSSRTQAQDLGNQGNPGAPNDVVVSDTVPRADQAKIKGYWTAERMRNAHAADVTPPGPPDSPPGSPPRPEGPPIKIDPKPPVSAAGVPSATVEPTATVDPTATTSNGYTYPFPFTRYEQFASYTQFPYRTNGKIFYTKATGGNFVCSGTVVNTRNSTSTGNLSTVWTAGHCVSDGQGRFHRNWIFVPAYKDGSAPLGRWAMRRLTTTSEWHNFSNFKQDVGAAVLHRDSSGVALQDRTGSQGISFNQPYPQHWHSFGYPSASPFNGARQHVCTASYARQDNPSSRSGPLTIGIGCDMTPGASGGGWILSFKGSGGFVNSVNSYKYTTPAQPLAMYGPYHGNEALNIYNFARTL